MSTDKNAVAISLFSEILFAEQKLRTRLTAQLPKGMEISHFSLLNHLAWHGEERSPASLAQTFNVTRGAITNTLNRLEWAGYIHIRPDWEDARRKRVTISPAGRQARDIALQAITPVMEQVMAELGDENVRATLPVLRALREQL